MDFLEQADFPITALSRLTPNCERKFSNFRVLTARVNFVRVYRRTCASRARCEHRHSICSLKFKYGRPYSERCAADVSRLARPPVFRARFWSVRLTGRARRAEAVIECQRRFLGRPGFRSVLARRFTSISSMIQVFPTLDALSSPCSIIAATRRGLTPNRLAASVVPIIAIRWIDRQ